LRNGVHGPRCHKNCGQHHEPATIDHPFENGTKHGDSGQNVATRPTVRSAADRSAASLG